MGIVYIKGTVSGNGKSVELDFLIDSGATYTLLPKSVWEDIGLKPKRTVNFILADGTKITRNVSECEIEILGLSGHTPIIMGESDESPLLGAVTLEEMGFVLDPFKREIKPAKMMLA